MRRYLIDTNIISETAKPEPATAIADWFQNQDGPELFLASLTIAEFWRGIMQLAPGKKRHDLERWFRGPKGLQTLFRDRILPFDEQAALEWGRIMAEGYAAGRPRSALDMIIAAIAVAHRCIVVTANERHFIGVVELVNPYNDPYDGCAARVYDLPYRDG